MCWFPRKPGRLRITREGYEHIVRCGACPGCYELERRWLADRFRARYRGEAADLWIARVWAEAAKHAGLSHRLHRRSALRLDPGFLRLGLSSFALITRDKHALAQALHAMHLDFRIERVRHGRRRRAWRGITAGLLVDRERYGEQVKRWYVRGLPKREKLAWEVEKRPYEKGYDRRRSPRAWTSSSLVLVPPEVWSMSRPDRRTLRALLRGATDPESVASIVAAATGQASALQSSFHRAGEAGSARDAAVKQGDRYDRGLVAVNDAARAASSSSSSSPSKGERYRSSVHRSRTEPAVPADIQAMIDHLAELARRKGKT